MNLSKNFTLNEMLRSNTASRLGIHNEPSSDDVSRMVYLAENILQPVRDHFGIPIRISSGFRNPELNRAVRGSSSSHHCFGSAADIYFAEETHFTNMDIFNFIHDNIPFTELILEEPSAHGWIHAAVWEGREHERQTKMKYVGDPRVYSVPVEEIRAYWDSLYR